MTLTATSKLHDNPPDDDVPFAEVLPLKDPRSGDGPTKAYAVGYKNYHDKNYHDTESGEPFANVVKEATVVENLGKHRLRDLRSLYSKRTTNFVIIIISCCNLGWDKDTRRVFIRKVYSILAVQLLVTGIISTFMILHAPTQVYVLTHGWPVTLSMFTSIGIIVALMCFKDKHPTNMYLLSAFTVVESVLVGSVTTGENMIITLYK